MKKLYFVTTLLALLFSLQTFAQAPAISSFSPASGPVGSTVTINGSNFNATAANNIVFFGTIKATVSSATATSLKVIAPVGSTYDPITVLNASNSLQGSSSVPFMVTFNESENKTFTSKSFSTASISASQGGVIVFLKLADIDCDGKLDLVIADFWNATIKIYKNTSTNGSLTSSSFTLAETIQPTTPGLTYSIEDVQVADLDGDGKPDIVVPYADQNSIAIFRNTATVGVINSQSFSQKLELTTYGSCYALAITDLDGDGKPEIVAANSGYLSIYKNNSIKGSLSSSSFAARQDVAAGTSLKSIQAADIDGDGKKDLIVGDDLGFTIMKNTTATGKSSSFVKTDISASTPSPHNAYIADFDGDGKMDVALISPNSSGIYVYKNASTSSAVSFAAPVTMATQATVTSLSIGDINGDTKPDILAITGGQNIVFPNNSAGALSFGSQVILSMNTNVAVIGDIDGDGKNDIVGSDSYTSLTLLHNNIVGAPVITSFSPASAMKGQTVTVTGKNFTGTTAVSFGGTSASSFQVSSPTSISAVVGSGATGSISVSTADGTATLSGFTFQLTPVITTSGTLTALTTTQGTPSSSTSFTVSGANMLAGILVTAPTGFEVSLDNTTFSNTVTVGTTGAIAATKVYIRLATADAAGTYSGNITLSSTSAASVNVATVSSTVSPPPQGIFFGSTTGSITTCQGQASVSPNIEQFPVWGLRLTGNITATAPTGFEISLTPGSGFGGTLTLTQSGGTVKSTIIYVRASASATPGALTGSISFTSPGSTSQSHVVTATIDALSAASGLSDQNIATGAKSNPIYLSGTADHFTWTNDNPSIGLPASGSDSIPSFTAVNNSTNLAKATISVTAAPTQLVAYVTHSQKNGLVTVINPLTGEVRANIPVGKSPRSVCIAPDGTKAYIGNIDSRTISVINTQTNTVSATISAGTWPSGIIFNHDGSKAYVALQGEDSVAVINTSANKVASKIHVGGSPYGLCMSPDGSLIYVTNINSSTVSVINTTTNLVVGTIAVGQSPEGITISADGKYVYVANAGIGSISVINTATNTVVSTVRLNPGAGNVILSKDGTKAYVSEATAVEGLGWIVIINTATNRAVKTITLVHTPSGLSLHPDGSKLYVTNGDNTVSTINTTTDNVISTVRLALDTPFYGAGVLGSFVTYNTSCNTSPATFTITVNPKNLILPATNFKLAITSATCKGSADGSITITADQNLNYTATITGNGLDKQNSFTTSTTIDNLAAGTYHVCITIDGQANFQQCYDAVISEPKDLSVYSTVNDATKTITLAMTGGNQYNIQLNGVNYQTTQSSMTLALADGNNDLTVTTDKLCQGTLQKVINISGKISPYPVPFQNTLYLNLGNTVSNNVAIEIHDVSSGKKVYSKGFGSQSGVLKLDLTSLDYGVYVLHLTMDNTEKIFKIFKQ